MEEQEFIEKLEHLKKLGKDTHIINISQILDEFPNATDEFLDKIELQLDQEGIEVSWEIEELDDNFDSSLDSLDIENENLEVLELDEDLEELTNIQESEIKVSDFDTVNPNSSQSNEYRDSLTLFKNEMSQYELLTVTQESEYARTVQQGLAAQEKIDYYEKIGKTLSKQELTELTEQIQNGEIAMDNLVNANYRLVIYNANKFKGRGLDIEDLIQEGNKGLVTAVKKFDVTKGWKFSTYATYWIKQGILRAIANHGRTIRIPVHMVDTINRMRRSIRKLTQVYRREPTSEEIALDLKWPVEKVLYIKSVEREPISMDTYINEDEDTSIADLIPDTSNDSPLEYSEKIAYKEAIDQVLKTLSTNEENVIRLLYGLDDRKPKTLEEVGKIFGLTRERIRQIREKALRRIKNPQRLEILKNAKPKSE